MSDSVWGEGLGAESFFAGHLMNSDACSNLEEVHAIIGRTFHLIVEGISMPFQIRGTIALVQLERSGRLSLIFSPPKTVIRIEKEDLILHGVRKEMYQAEPWKLLLSPAVRASEDGTFIVPSESRDFPPVNFRLL